MDKDTMKHYKIVISHLSLEHARRIEAFLQNAGYIWDREVTE